MHSGLFILFCLIGLLWKPARLHLLYLVQICKLFQIEHRMNANQTYVLLNNLYSVPSIWFYSIRKYHWLSAVNVDDC